MLQSTVEKKRAVPSCVIPLTPKMHSFKSLRLLKSLSVCLTHLETFSTGFFRTYIQIHHTRKSMITTNYPNLIAEDLKPPAQSGASKSLLHNRNSTAGLIRQFFFYCGQTG